MTTTTSLTTSTTPSTPSSTTTSSRTTTTTTATTTTESVRRRLFGSRRNRPIRIFTTSTTVAPTRTTTKRTSFIPRSATESLSEKNREEINEEETTKRFVSPDTERTTEGPISISAEDRRLLLSKLFGGRKRHSALG